MNKKEQFTPVSFIENKEKKTLLKGEWTIYHAAHIEDELEKEKKAKREGLNALDAGGIQNMDTAGVWLIRKYFPDVPLERLSERHQALIDFLPEMPEGQRKGPAHIIRDFFIIIGKNTLWGLDFVYAIFSFIGEIFIRFLANFLHPRRFRLASIVRHIHETGVKAIPIIGLLGGGVSMVIFYQGATQLRKFGADIFTVDLTMISMLREMAVLTTAIMVAGRSGSAYAAEIGVMKLRGEIDALRTIGMDPIETLVVPRVLALILTLPLLSFFASLVGLFGAGLMANLQLDLSPAQYLDRVQSTATPIMFYTGLIKAPVFALLIAIICTYQGMNASGSAENVGKLTTLAVVQSIFLVIAVDSIFSVVFSKAGI